ncbi:hypothetical protein KIH86_04105 [Paenibacillus sp. HN-1]|uniref:hypothetical protein n=1 Tax=Paenibacillus TaxID=44249 RepID=UPI001CA987E4|nr:MULTISPECIES: hypothetical protein [Paenibacillus]MBY9077112.1 hypothetical protein [Paenibacillus sp. CGMCC 1.18879]MBY9083410.1 hypothetical protein [Paenibacillus sinensis]
MKRKFLLQGLLFLTLMGCSSNKAPSADDLAIDKADDVAIAIQRVDDSKQVVQYGMSKEEAEKVLGQAESTNRSFMTYPDGVIIIYRNDKVCAISLREESSGVYQTENGAEVGMRKDEIIEKYGEQHAMKSTEKNLDYGYDTGDKQYLTEWERSSKEKMEQQYQWSFSFNDAGVADSIILSDHRAAMYME